MDINTGLDSRPRLKGRLTHRAFASCIKCLVAFNISRLVGETA
jgi:hypothetical protein